MVAACAPALWIVRTVLCMFSPKLGFGAEALVVARQCSCNLKAHCRHHAKLWQSLLSGLLGHSIQLTQTRVDPRLASAADSQRSHEQDKIM
jgi:hypothetical protein